MAKKEVKSPFTNNPYYNQEKQKNCEHQWIPAPYNLVSPSPHWLGLVCELCGKIKYKRPEIWIRDKK